MAGIAPVGSTPVSGQSAFFNTLPPSYVDVGGTIAAQFAGSANANVIWSERPAAFPASSAITAMANLRRGVGGTIAASVVITGLPGIARTASGTIAALSLTATTPAYRIRLAQGTIGASGNLNATANIRSTGQGTISGRLILAAKAATVVQTGGTIAATSMLRGRGDGWQTIRTPENDSRWTTIAPDPNDRWIPITETDRAWRDI
jgi:alkylated DNA nucleotide flippase Atl1